MRVVYNDYSPDSVAGVVICLNQVVTRPHDALHARLVGVQLGREILVLLHFALKVGRILDSTTIVKIC